MRSQSLVFHVSFFIVILAKKWPHAPFGALFVGYNMRPFGAGLLLALSGIKNVTCGSCYARMKACVG